ncbi:hypothetical protein HRbin09_00349 [bacterium HR09]|nr:hypothetical protein HRbin09_00349 [bacterium HR09]
MKPWTLFVFLCFVLAQTGTASEPTVVFFPGVAHAPGASGTAWRSEVILHNPTGTSQQVELALLPRGSGAVAVASQLVLAVGETRRIPDLYAFLRAPDGAGMVRITGEVVAWVRTYNQGASGTFGQDLVPVDASSAYTPSEPLIFPFSATADIKTGFRSNLLLVNLEPVAITFTLRAGTAEKTVSVPAGAYSQIDNLGSFLGAASGFSVVQVSATGRWFAAISTVDPVTGDPTTLRGLGAGDSSERLFAGVAKLPGANQTSWRSEAVFYNPTSASLPLTLELIPRGQGNAAARANLTLAAGETRYLPDLYQTLGVASGAGTLKVQGGALAWVRTFNRGNQGSFGQDLPPATPSLAVGSSIPVALSVYSPTSPQTDFRSNLVVQNLENRDITLSLRAGVTEKSQVIKANSYTQIDNLGNFMGLPPGAATVWAQANGRWLGAMSTIDPVTGDPTTFRDARGFLPPSSYDLIEAALANQTISSEQALTYKVFADFGDSRLPAQFQGDDRNTHEALGTAEAAEKFATLSPATQEVVGPYLVQPFYAGSWWDRRRAGVTGVSALATMCRPWAITCPILSGDWEYYDGTYVRVWYLKSHAATDAAVARALAAAATSDIWPKFTASMGRVPKSDGDEGGSALYDVVLSDGLSSRTYGSTFPTALTACNNAPAFSYLNRTISDLNIFKSILAHETFHGVQIGFNSRQCPTSMRWLSEGTATWFEDFVYPTTNREHDDAPHYLDKPYLAIDNDGGDTLKPYGTYTFFYYLTRIRGLAPDVIGKIWNATAGADGLHALDSALRSVSAELDKSWPDFAVYAWNQQAPFNLFTNDGLTDGAKVNPPRTGTLSSRDASWEVIPKTKPPLPRLSLFYYHYDFPDASVAALGFFNGLTRSLNVQTVDEFGKLYSASPLTGPDTAKGGHVTALVKINGTWKKEDWTPLAGRLYCRDLKAERVESLVIILSNADVSEISSVWPKGDYPPLLFATNLGCAHWEGEASLTYRWGNSVTETMNVAGLRLEPVAEGFYDENTPVFRGYAPFSGDYSYVVRGTNGDCSYSADNNGTLTSGLSAFHVLTWVTGGVGYRGLTTGLFWEWTQALMILKETCPLSTKMLPWNAGEFVLPVIPEFAWARVTPDGRRIVIQASDIPGQQGLSGTWTFRALREP